MHQVPQFRKAGSRSQTIPGTETPEVQLYLEKRAARDEAQAELDEAEVAVVAQARDRCRDRGPQRRDAGRFRDVSSRVRPRGRCPSPSLTLAQG